MIVITITITTIIKILITRFFDKIFATGHQITEFHSLLAQSAKSSVITEVQLLWRLSMSMRWRWIIWQQESQKSSVEDNIQMVEVRQSFRHGSHFYVRCFIPIILLFLNITKKAVLFFIVTWISLCRWKSPLPVKFDSDDNFLTVEDCSDQKFWSLQLLALQ